MTSATSNFYVFKCDECFDKWKRVIYVTMGFLLLFLLTFFIVLISGVVNVNAIFAKKQFVQALTKPYGDVPGTTFLNKGYNILDGNGFGSAYGNSIGEFTRNKGKAVSVNGVVGYEPDQISITTNAKCDQVNYHSTVYQSGSIGIVLEQANSFAYGGVIVDSVGNNTNVTMAFVFGQTKMTQASLAFSGSQYQSEFIVSSSARLLDAKVAWNNPQIPFKYNKAFIEALKKISKTFNDKKKRNKALMEFAGEYGTHVIERAEFGAMCHTCVVSDGASGSISGSIIDETQRFMGISSGFSFQASNASYDRVGVSFTGGGGYNYQVAYKSCDGLMSVNPCDASMATGIDEPVITKFRLIPIGQFKINDVGTKNVAKNFEMMMDEFYGALYECSIYQCHHNGACVTKSSLWSNGGLDGWDGDFADYTQFFEAGVCIDW